MISKSQFSGSSIKFNGCSPSSSSTSSSKSPDSPIFATFYWAIFSINFYPSYFLAYMYFMLRSNSLSFFCFSSAIMIFGSLLFISFGSIPARKLVLISFNFTNPSSMNSFHSSLSSGSNPFYVIKAVAYHTKADPRSKVFPLGYF